MHSSICMLPNKINDLLQRKSVYTKEAGGKEGYVMIGNNMIMYEPAFDKTRQRNLTDNLTGNYQERVPMNSVFNDQNLEHMHYLQDQVSRNSMTKNFISTPIQYQALNLNVQPPRFINRLNSAMAVRGDDHLSQSRNEAINLCLDQKIETNRPLTSYVSDNYKTL